MVLPTLCPLNGANYCTVTEPTPCPINPLAGDGSRFGCMIVDLRIAVASSLGGVPSDEYGLLVRFLVPTTPRASTPLLFEFHGTGDKGVTAVDD